MPMTRRQFNIAALGRGTKARHVEDNLMAATGRMPDAELRKKQERFFDSL